MEMIDVEDTSKDGTCNLCAAVNATVSSVEPPAQNLTQNGAVVTVEGQPVLLFQAAVQIWGSYVQELSVGPSASDSLATASASRRLRQYYTSDDSYMESDSAQEESSYINKYYLVPNSSDNHTFTITNGAVQEGYYRLSAKVSLLTVLPNLVDLQGMATVNQVYMINTEPCHRTTICLLLLKSFLLLCAKLPHNSITDSKCQDIAAAAG